MQQYLQVFNTECMHDTYMYANSSSNTAISFSPTDRMYIAICMVAKGSYSYIALHACMALACTDDVLPVVRHCIASANNIISACMGLLLLLCHILHRLVKL